MNAQEAMKLCQPYLDGHLDAAARAEIDALLAGDPELAKAFEAQRAYHEFLKRACSAGAPHAFQVKLAAQVAAFAPKAEQRVAVAQSRGTAVIPLGRPDLETVRQPVYRKRMAVHSSPLALAAAVMLSLGGYVFYQSTCLTGQCPYIQAASAEFQRIERRSDHLGMMSDDPVRLARFVDDRFEMDLPAVPQIAHCGLRLKGACGARFNQIRLLHPDLPPAAVVCYECCRYGIVALMLHKMPEDAIPQPYTRHVYNGKVYYVDEQMGSHAVCWKTRGDKMLCSLVGKMPLDKLLAAAEEAREQLDR
ncbi:MAG: hypothetical protein KIS92_14880 [Planctomycetota bacterium]|nr:hypothetical protein [Planctomycetota bacterium]